MAPLSAVVEKLSGFLQEGPTDFEITILPTTTSTNATSTSTSNERLTIDESIVLIDGKHLGLDARSLPWVTWEIRQDYRQCRKQRGDGNDTTTELLLWLTVTSCLLLVNPDHATAWADRRRCLLLLLRHSNNDDNDDDDYWRQELTFLNLLMTQHSKAPSSWGHRKYVLGKIIDQIRILLPNHEPIRDRRNKVLVQLARDEIAMCTTVAERYPKNYYAWTHRRYLWSVIQMVDEAGSSSSSTTGTSSMESLWREEFLTICKWLQQHVSDHSAAHYGAQVLELIMQNGNDDDDDDDDMAQHALEEVRKLFQRRHHDEEESHETMWIFRRMIVRILLNNNNNNHHHHQARALAQQEIQSVYQKYATVVGHDEDDEEGSNKKNNSNGHHVWTFLMWCVVQLQNLGTETNNNTMDLLLVGEVDLHSISSKAISMLQDHPNITHQMWNVYGSSAMSR